MLPLKLQDDARVQCDVIPALEEDNDTCAVALYWGRLTVISHFMRYEEGNTRVTVSKQILKCRGIYFVHMFHALLVSVFSITHRV